MTEHGPDFICVGMEKAGTGWLHDQISKSAGAWMTPIKELNYFHGEPFTGFNLRRLDHLARLPDLSDRDRAFVRVFGEGRLHGKNDAWYRALFANKNGLVSGDVSPNYAMATGAEIAGALRQCPDARYVFLVRHPVRRLWSALCMRVRKAQMKPEDLAAWPSVAAALARPDIQARAYPTRIWANWAAAVPTGALRHWFLEDIAETPGRVREEVLAFVGLEGARVALAPDYNRKKEAWKVPMPPDIEARLADAFAEEIRACAAVFGGRALEWSARPVSRSRPDATTPAA